MRQHALILAAVFITLLCAYVLISDGNYYVNKNLLFAGFSAYVLVSCLVVYAIGLKTNWMIEYAFLGVYISLGLLTLLAIPPMSTPDSAPQFYRAFEIAHGSFFTVYDGPSGGGCSLPA